jgi:transcriptional regulator with XRE-family HTH domain
MLYFDEKMPGTVIRKYREMRNYSQTYVASRLGISQNAYSKIENNITQLTVHHVKQLSQVLEIPITDLLKDDFEIHKPFHIPQTVTRADLLEKIQHLEKRIAAQHIKRHESYIVAMSLIVAAENAVSSVH